MRPLRNRLPSVIPVLLACCTVSAALAQDSGAGGSVPHPLPGQPHPAYPPAALEQSVEGMVRFRAEVSPDGTVGKVLVIEVPEADLGFEAAVIETVMRWRFEPATENGLPVRGQYEGAVQFYMKTPRTQTPTQGRIYPISSGELWNAVRSVFEEYGFKYEEFDSPHGTVITKWRRPAGKRFKAMEFSGLPRGARADQFQLHVFVPPWAEPGRLYIGSQVLSRTGASGRVLSYNVGDVESWFYERVESHLGTRGHGIPDDLGLRQTLVHRLLGDDADDACREGSSIQLGGVGTVSNPVLILSTKEEPPYPETGLVKRERAVVILQAIIREDGFVSDIEVLRNNSSNPKFAVSAVHTVSLWRYQPARMGDCPVSVYFTVFVEFKLH